MATSLFPVVFSSALGRWERFFLFCDGTHSSRVNTMRGVERKKRKKKAKDRQMRIRVIVTMMMSHLQMKVMKMKNTTMSLQMKRKASAGMSLKSVLRRVSLLSSLLTTTTQRRSLGACARLLSLVALSLGVHSQRSRNSNPQMERVPELACCVKLLQSSCTGDQWYPDGTLFSLRVVHRLRWSVGG